MVKAKIPARFVDQPELVEAVIDARRLQMETGNDAVAIKRLLENYPMTIGSATRALNDETFQYAGLYPEGHPGLESLRAEGRAKSRRQAELRKIKPAVIERDGGRCQNCGKRVWGKDATLDHKDPEGPGDLENVHLLCRACNTLKGRRTWDEFQQARAEWRAALEKRQNARPDIICQQTGLSIKGRSWQESGCLTPDLCPRAGDCDNGEYEKWAAEMDATVEAMHAAQDI